MSLLTILKVLGGVALLIYGIKTMGEVLQNLAGDSLRRLIGALTETPLKGVAVGAVVTVLLQSSSATTVMVVSFVHAGLMTLAQAIGVIMGANIGTTLTAQLIAFQVHDLALATAVVGSLLSILGRNRRQKQIGTGLMGFSLLFIGMDMMSNGMGFLRGRTDLFTPIRQYPLLGVLVGTGFTMLVQASSATVGLTMAMAAEGLLPLNSAIAIIFGDNIGTTITAVLASLGGNRSAKQAAAAHVLFNVLGTVIMMCFLPWITELISLTADDPARQVANAHTFFNVGNTLIFLPFVKQYSAFIQKILPSDGIHSPRATRYLDPNLIAASPAAAVNAVRKEMIQMQHITIDMLEICKTALVDGDARRIDEVLESEKIVDEINHDILRYAVDLSQKGISAELAIILNSCVNGVGDIERIGDHTTNLVESAQFLAEKKLQMSDTAREELREMFDLVILCVRRSAESIETEKVSIVHEIVQMENHIDEMEKDLRMRHIERLNEGDCNPSVGIVFVDILSNLERVSDHAQNIACIVLDIGRIHKDPGVAAR